MTETSNGETSRSETLNADAVEAAPESVPQIEQGTYELIRDRLIKARALNDRRLGVFGGTELAVVGNVRIRTENNCVPRDIAQVGDRLLFGYNVFIGLKKQTEVSDVFSAHRLTEQNGSFHLESGPPG